MGKDEILLLLRLKGWSRRHLADEIGIERNVIDRWLMSKPDRQPGQAASRLMRLWLREARGEIRITEVPVAEREPVPV